MHLRTDIKLVNVDVETAKFACIAGTPVYFYDQYRKACRVNLWTQEKVTTPLYIKKKIVHLNELCLSCGLNVTKKPDNSHDFYIAVDYDVYEVDLTKEESDVLGSFLAKEYDTKETMEEDLHV